MSPDRERAEHLLAQRQDARARNDYAAADELRGLIDQLGFLVVDTAEGPRWEAKPAYEMVDPARGFPEYAVGSQIAVTVIVDGWLADAMQFITAIIDHEPESVHVLAVECSGDASIAESLEEATAASARIHVVHAPAGASWAALHSAAANSCAAPMYAVADMSSVVSGPALSRCADELRQRGELVAVGWRGANVNQADQWRSVEAVDDGECDVLMSYLMALRTADAREVPPHPKARFYRNADIEWCLRIREHHWQANGTPARMLALGDAIPVHQTRHHGYHDSDESLRDRESRKTYDRILAAFRGRAELLGD
jgi:hypothetical protein